MLDERILAWSVPVADPVNYASNPESAIRSYLARRFVGRNIGGSMVLRIVRIVDRSSCTIVSTNLKAEGVVNVRFIAEVTAMGAGDIVTGVTVVRGPDFVIGHSRAEGVAAAMLHPTPGLEAIRSDDEVAVRIIAPPIYEYNKTVYTVIGELLTCDRDATTYAVAGSLASVKALILGGVGVGGLLGFMLTDEEDAALHTADLPHDPHCALFLVGAPGRHKPVDLQIEETAAAALRAIFT